jgi:hypothetical protein
VRNFILPGKFRFAEDLRLDRDIFAFSQEPSTQNDGIVTEDRLVMVRVCCAIRAVITDDRLAWLSVSDDITSNRGMGAFNIQNIPDSPS